ncbi:MAG TPA: glycoside hydrolase family 2 TIM barrel-domain containing protein [Chitinophagaceae bacterium]|nr:glycoside hydrolase family 2 TIM barrel-domain containing protein [Chitinophagaceae bacterium]
MRFNRFLLPALLGAFLCLSQLPGQAQRRTNFDRDWKFLKGDPPGSEQPGFNDSGWRGLDLPHDWSIEGPFSPDNPAGYSGGALPGRIGWYRKVFKSREFPGQHTWIEFDGVYMNSKVWINGHLLGNRPYGYSSFWYDLTPWLHSGSPNVLAVRVDNSLQPNSRWYSGSGIYRHVWMIRTGSVHVDQWGSYVTTPEVDPGKALVRATLTLSNDSSRSLSLTLVNRILDPSGKEVASRHLRFQAPASGKEILSDSMEVTHPRLWSPSTPGIYTLESEIYSGKRLLDQYRTSFGIRTFRFDPSLGLILNGKRLKILGVCDHHDLGCLGSALNDRALERQLQILKAAGVNAIRTSHNPPAPELLDLCDRLGLVVMDEAFDCWYLPKVKYDYHLYFGQWHQRDLSDMVLRDRNHPSIILWSIGNEIPEQGSKDGGKIATELAGIVHSLDPTRPVTSACNGIVSADQNGFAAALDVVGINYSIGQYDKQKARYPDRKFFGSETTSAFESRGVYFMPADSYHLKSPTLQSSSYDNSWAPWGSGARDGWRAIRDRDFMAGMFIWTGFDYIGEPTPYQYPAHSSYFGFVDLCGFPKDAYYFYQSQWTSKPMVHLLPHWNWNEGQSVDVWAYTNCDSVSLYLNGAAIGTRAFANKEQMKLSWKVVFRPGTLEARGWKGGKVVATATERTASAPSGIRLDPDRSILRADGTDLSFVTVRVEDAKGTLSPDADNLVHFSLTGPGAIAGVDNGDPTSLEPYQGNQRKAFHGMCLVVVRTTRKAGLVTLTATGDGLKTARVTLASR